MSQYWGPPSYPPPRPPQYQPPQLEPGYYYEPEPDRRVERILYFLAGSCSTLILLSCCVVALGAAWIVDDRLGITAAGVDLEAHGYCGPGFSSAGVNSSWRALAAWDPALCWWSGNARSPRVYPIPSGFKCPFFHWSSSHR